MIQNVKYKMTVRGAAEARTSKRVALPRRLDGAVHRHVAPHLSSVTAKTKRQRTWYLLGKRVRSMFRLWFCRVRHVRAKHAVCRIDGVRISRELFWHERMVQIVATAHFGRFSLVGMFVLGMFSMVFVTESFGQSAEAGQVAGAAVQVAQADAADTSVSREEELSDADLQVFSDLMADLEEQEQFEDRLRDMVAGYPIEQMIPYIAKQDRLVAIFLVSIAKKESNWGKRVPVLNGQDCYNYWGFRAVRDRMGTGGHTCFDTRQDAVESVAKRIKKLVEKEQLNTPQKMVVWKCGYSCAGHSREGVRKWISDVDMYFEALNHEENDGSLTSKTDSRRG